MSPVSVRPSARTFAVLAFMCVISAAVGAITLQGAISDSENVCISVSVIGLDDGDPGTGCTVVADIPSSSSSSSTSSASSSGSSLSSAASSAAAQESGSSRPSDGAYRYSRERSHWKIVQLLRQWTRRNALHAAPQDAWYDEAVRALQQKGYVDVAGDLRLDASATRAETAKLVVLSSDPHPDVPSASSFDDAITGAWYVPFIERAAEHGWMIGYNNCYGRHPCYFRPAAVITRAEAAATFVRVFELYPSYTAPRFADVPYQAWYRDAVQAAADACIVQGQKGILRPDDMVTRAELFVMFYRALGGLQYGTDCVSEQDTTLHSAPDAVAPDMQDEPVCSASVPMCLYEAIKADLGSMARSLGASLLSFDVRSVWQISASEWLIWGIFLLLPIILIAVFRWRKHTHKTPS